MYGPVFLLLLFNLGKLPIPEVLIMTAIGMFLEFSWDKFATTYGFWVYEKNFIGVNVWGTVPIEMLYFSFPSGTSVVLVTRAIKKVLKIK
jgi:lycopene cyclase domain-containing protein